MERRDIGLALALVALLCTTNAFAQTAANPLLAIDQHRTTVVERVIGEWGDKLSATSAGVNREQLREMLFAMRADQLLAASLAGSLTGLRDVLAHSLTTAATAKPGLQQVKALGDSGDDVVYTPVTPCRLVETRGTFAAVYQTGGAFSGGEIRNYTIQGGNGVCLTQLPAGLNPSAVQLQVFGIPINSGASGDIEILPQGSTFGSTATEVYVGNVAFNTVSTTAKINLANNQIGVQVRGGGADVAIDVVGYFRRPGNYGGTHVITGQYATDSGGFNNIASGASSTVAGGFNNTASGMDSTVAGGAYNTASSGDSTVGGGFGNIASGGGSTVAGGEGNTASGYRSFAAGAAALADQDQCFVFANWSSFPGARPHCLNLTNVARFLLDHGLSVEYSSARSDGGGNRWVYIGDTFANQTIVTWTGAYLSNTGVWTNNSDVNRKTDFEMIDPREVLGQVARLPITRWRYVDEHDSKRHLGPMAQDFWVAFGLGDDATHIGTIDEGGVALAAIQGLNAKLDERVADQQREITELRRMLLELRSAIEVKAAMH